MPTMEERQLADGTQFITHTAKDDFFVFEVKEGDIVSVTVRSKWEMKYYREHLSEDGAYEKSALDVEDGEKRHNTIHAIMMEKRSITRRDDHEHFTTRQVSKGTRRLGIHALPVLIPKMSPGVVMEIVNLTNKTTKGEAAAEAKGAGST
jgi:hypothetical protein